MAASQKATMARFFPPQALDSVRIRVLQGRRVENPTFYPVLTRMGLSNLPDISRMTAITFADVIVSHEPFTDGLQFHELVHAEQYRQLVIPRFSDFYVRGFILSLVVGTKASRSRPTPTTSAVGSRKIPASLFPWPKKWRNASGKGGFEP
jgi:hypothetical protein